MVRRCREKAGMDQEAGKPQQVDLGEDGEGERDKAVNSSRRSGPAAVEGAPLQEGQGPDLLLRPFSPCGLQTTPPHPHHRPRQHILHILQHPSQFWPLLFQRSCGYLVEINGEKVKCGLPLRGCFISLPRKSGADRVHPRERS